jgi:hypothetical protein
MGIEMLRGYLECALWTNELDVHDIQAFDLASVFQAFLECEAFEKAAEKLGFDLDDYQSGREYSAREKAGHDLWLSRNGHGSGFWDRDLGEIGDALDDLARDMGERWAYVGDDEETVHIS